jgi:hypothetical protein
MNNLPVYINLLFEFTTLLTVWFFYKASGNSTTTLLILFAWVLLQAVVGLSGFYSVTTTFPPRFLLLVVPPVLTIALLFATAKGRQYIDRLNIKTLTILHVIRIPVELTLYFLFLNKTVPELMTFEGRNFDILAGLTAPFIFYFAFMKKTGNKKLLLWWNVICLGLLLNIVVNAVLAAPFPFQQFAFDQPNIAVLYFPFNWLPGCVVPLVLFSHLAVIRRLLKK